MEKQEIIDLLGKITEETKNTVEIFFLEGNIWENMTELQREYLKHILLKEIKDLWELQE